MSYSASRLLPSSPPTCFVTRMLEYHIQCHKFVALRNHTLRKVQFLFQFHIPTVTSGNLILSHNI